MIALQTETFSGQQHNKNGSVEQDDRILSPAQKYLQSRINTPYKTRNAYRNKKSWQQIATLCVFILQLALHSSVTAPKILQTDQKLLRFFFILNYFMLGAVIMYYMYLTVNDPVDSLIINSQQRECVERNSPNEIQFCVMCQQVAKKTSFHCFYCGRCTEQYDHHCKCLNNCIGIINYQEYIRMLLFYELYNIIVILQAIWVIKETENWNGGNIFLIVLSFLIFIPVLLLLIFHGYLNCKLKMTTFQFFRKWRGQKYSVGDKLQPKHYTGDELRPAPNNQNSHSIDESGGMQKGSNDKMRRLVKYPSQNNSIENNKSEITFNNRKAFSFQEKN